MHRAIIVPMGLLSLAIMIAAIVQGNPVNACTMEQVAQGLCP